ncbi:MAG: hypothetical protein AB7K68_02405 [Bacteriovoracia bacterium]
MKPLKTLFFFLTLTTISLPAFAAEWEFLATDLSDAENHDYAITELKKTPDLEQSLKAALLDPERRQLAADVIVALQLKSLAPHLVVSASVEASGTLFVSLLELDPEGREPAIAHAYKNATAHLGLARQAPATTVALLDRLPGVEKALSPKKISRLLQHSSHEVRIALARRLTKPEKVSSKIVAQLLASKPYQVRWETISALASRPNLDSATLAAMRKQCALESRAEFKQICSRLVSDAGFLRRFLSSAVNALGIPEAMATPPMKSAGKKKTAPKRRAVADDEDGIDDTSTLKANEDKIQARQQVEFFSRLQTAIKGPPKTLGEVCSEENGDPILQEFCLKRYASLDGKPAIRFDIFSGYQNFGNIVRDSIERTAWIEWLQLPCKAGNRVCGFQREADDADVLYKEITWSDGSTKRIEFRIYDASVSTNDAYNEKSEAQRVKTEQVKSQFADSLRNSDLVFYMGHSRYGGGPDFGPEKRKPNRKWDIGYYKKNRPGLKLMADAMKERKDGSLFLLGLMSCDSRHHFEANVKSIGAADRTLLSKNLVGSDEGYDKLIEVAEGVLAQSCEPLARDDKLFELKVKASFIEVGKKATVASTEADRKPAPADTAVASAAEIPISMVEIPVPKVAKAEEARPVPAPDPAAIPPTPANGENSLVRLKMEKKPERFSWLNNSLPREQAPQEEVPLSVTAAEPPEKVVAVPTAEEIQRLIDKAVKEQVAEALKKIEEEKSGTANPSPPAKVARKSDNSPRKAGCVQRYGTGLFYGIPLGCGKATRGTTTRRPSALHRNGCVRMLSGAVLCA